MTRLIPLATALLAAALASGGAAAQQAAPGAPSPADAESACAAQSWAGSNRAARTQSPGQLDELVGADNRSPNMEIVRRWYEAQKARDKQALYDLLDPEVVFYEADDLPMGGVYPTAQGVIDGLMPVLGPHFAEFTVDRDGLIDAGDRIISFGYYRAKAAATGRPLTAQFVHIYTVRDGRIHEMRQIANTLDFLCAFGEADSRRLADQARQVREQLGSTTGSIGPAASGAVD